MRKQYIHAGAVAAAVLVIGVATPLPSIGAEASDPPKTSAAAPRVGLALSGGGARGAAHIGVLKVLEELRVPVHCVAGTSFGAIVGGTYASGVTPRKLEEIIRTTDWDDVFRDRPPREDIAIRRKADDYKTLFAPEYGIKDGSIVLPKGIVAGVAIESFLRKLTAPAAGIDDFGKLPIPFRAVAADIETGEEVVLARGNVAQAMRASMAIPGAIAPVEIDGRLLVDGGIANNLPIDVVRKLCAADVVIAVNIGTPPLKREEITSALSISAQLLNFLGKASVDRQLASLGPRDILIAPELADISSGSFERTPEAIGIGETAARAAAESLKRYSLGPEEYAALRAKQVREQQTLGRVNEIRLQGLSRTNPEVLRSLVRSAPDKELSEEEIGADLRRIYGRGDFESMDYRIVAEPDQRALEIYPREKSWGPNYLRFGLGLTTDFRGDAIYSAMLSFRSTWLNRLGAEWLTDLRMGTNSWLSTEFYQPIEERGRWFVAPYAGIGQNTRNLYVNEDRVAKYHANEGRVGIDGGAALGTFGEVRIGALWRRVSAKVDIGSPLLPDTSENASGVRAKFFVDQLDHPWFARRGYRFNASVFQADESLGSDRNYKKAEADATGAGSWGAHVFQLTLVGGTDLGTDMAPYDTFTLGGPLRLSGFRIDEFSGERMAFARILYFNHAIKLPQILGRGVYVGGSLEAGQVHEQINGAPDTKTHLSASVFLSADTFLGPSYFGFGVGEGGRASLYLMLGVP
ncbi:MAG TPA: patatin-like phospholipase family protein [Burkholderiales bacterium]|nr:patatin-like phospholipase family protein [Burkholderiales bacterium]